MTTQTYQAASRTLLAQARNELATGDLRQASEKVWGAAAQMVKAVASGRGWRHNSHRELLRAVRRLRRESGDADISRLFDVAQIMHTNFYEDWEEAQDIAQSLEDVERFVDLLEPLV